MRLLVIIRQVYEQKSVRWDYQKGELGYKRATINRADFHALQWAYEYATKQNGKMDVFLLAREKVEKKTLDILNGFPIELCFHIERGESDQEDAAFMETLLSCDMYDLIVSGEETEDDHDRSLVPLLGTSLNIPSLTSVHHIEADEKNNLLAHRKEERGMTQVFKIQLPAALSVTTQISKLSYRKYKPKRPMKTVIKQRDLKNSSSIKRIGAPEPNIFISDDIPDEESAESRLLHIMGFSSKGNAGPAKRTQTLSEEHLYYTAERLMKWLKE
ncbi:adenine nucleotide alpha hydrolase family protein [Siminovitchia acidinfaciens]|uniref:hypothetical protein n=1 Tax=Siminovitchia acidinfaciens TaxID=2321395 RepID=UPI0013E04D8D|nr:hypothetical protein [Siminovitchia acidinfaciens]